MTTGNSNEWVIFSAVSVLMLLLAATGLWMLKKALQRSLRRMTEGLRTHQESEFTALTAKLERQSQSHDERLNAAISRLQTTTQDKLMGLRDVVGALHEQVHELQSQTGQLAGHATQWSQHVVALEGQTLSKLTDLDHRLGSKVQALADQLAQQDQALAVLSRVVREPRQTAAYPDQTLRLDRLQNDITFIKTRTNTYLGGGAGLTWLVDETPIYVNTDDFGCPSNFMNGGRYEEEYYQVLASFRRPDSTFLDIGANLGVFSLRLAPLLRRGKVFAFEPNPRIFELFSRSVHLNGMGGWVHPLKMGASDHDSELTLVVPEGHAGGGHLTPAGPHTSGEKVPVRRLDDALKDLTHFDLAKVDVEGHELQALRGMPRLLRHSTHAVLLFEKLTAHSGLERPLLDIFEQAGMGVYRIDGLQLVPVDEATFCASEAYFLAAKPERVGQELLRNFIDIYPEDSFAIGAAVEGQRWISNESLPSGTVMFHGPYWYLPRGSYRLSVIGEVSRSFKLSVNENFGYPVASFDVDSSHQTFDFIVPNDLSHFEVVATSVNGSAAFSIERLRLTRVG